MDNFTTAMHMRHVFQTIDNPFSEWQNRVLPKKDQIIVIEIVINHDIKSVIDAAALQNNMAQRYSLPGSKMAIQVSMFRNRIVILSFRKNQELIFLNLLLLQQRCAVVVRILSLHTSQFALIVAIL